MTAPCECAAAGFCERHKMAKGEHLVALCRTNEAYRQRWDEQAAKVEKVCGAWQAAGHGKFRCRDCGRLLAGASIDQLPKNRPCIKPITSSPAPPTANGGGCGGCGQPAPAPEMPPMAERVGNFFSFLGEFIQEPGMVSKDEAQAAAAVCEGCDRRNGHFCSVCGCWIVGAVKLKAKHCPLGKWDRDAAGWTPHVHDRWLAATCVVIPAYGKVELTQDCVRDCLREPVNVLVIDNKGDYVPVGREEVIRREANIGWGRACNLGIDWALDHPAFERVVLLNNDVRLSPDFFSGLIVAESVAAAKLVGSSSAVSNSTADDFSLRPVHHVASVVASPAVLIARKAIERVGSFDASLDRQDALANFEGRARQAGLASAITQASCAYRVLLESNPIQSPEVTAIP